MFPTGLSPCILSPNQFSLLQKEMPFTILEEFQLNEKIFSVDLFIQTDQDRHKNVSAH